MHVKLQISYFIVTNKNTGSPCLEKMYETFPSGTPTKRTRKLSIQMGLANVPTCERYRDKDETASHSL
jgi:hypothetical protein